MINIKIRRTLSLLIMAIMLCIINAIVFVSFNKKSLVTAVAESKEQSVYISDNFFDKMADSDGINRDATGSPDVGSAIPGRGTWVENDKLCIPIHVGRYEVPWYDWFWSSWTQWGEENNKNTYNAEDRYSTYRGNKDKLYETQERTEKVYRKQVNEKVAKTWYVTKYKFSGFIPVEYGSWNGYPGAKWGHKIVGYKTETKEVNTGNKVWQNSEWSPSRPIGYDRTPINSRVVYRNRHKSLS